MSDQAQLPNVKGTEKPTGSTAAKAATKADAASAPALSVSSIPPAPPPAAPPAPVVPVVIKKYANRRLYNTETSSYITQDNLAEMVKAGRDFVVYDARSGEDITRSVLTQIIVEAESKGTSMLPTPFLRQLIGFYGDSLQSVVPRYLEQAMATFAHQQQQMRQAYQQALTPFMPFNGIEEIGRQNMVMMERAMTMFNSFYRANDPARAEPPRGGAPETEIESLRHEVDRLNRALEAASQDQSERNSDKE